MCQRFNNGAKCRNVSSARQIASYPPKFVPGNWCKNSTHHVKSISTRKSTCEQRERYLAAMCSSGNVVVKISSMFPYFQYVNILIYRWYIVPRNTPLTQSPFAQIRDCPHETDEECGGNEGAEVICFNNGSNNFSASFKIFSCYYYGKFVFNLCEKAWRFGEGQDPKRETYFWTDDPFVIQLARKWS